MSYVAQSMCRNCAAYCPVNVTIDEGKVVKVEGNPDAPLYENFICPKGRALAADHNDVAGRLMHSMKRLPDGSYAPISNEQLVEEISDKLRDIVHKHGPTAVATFLGGPSLEQQASAAMMLSFLVALGSDAMFGDGTIDQPGVNVAAALHGEWLGGHMRPENSDVYLIIGGNPVISKQYFPQNPGQQLKGLVKRGSKLIVIDPRRTETARRAHVHLQCIPGEDPTILAGLIHLIIKNGAVNREFVDLNAAGLEQLTQAVSGFTPEYVAARAGIAEEDLQRAARILGEATSGDFASGTGTTMSTRGTLSCYLMRCLQTLRGFWAPAGQEAVAPAVLLPRINFKAQPAAPTPGWGIGRKFGHRGLEQTPAGQPLGGLVDELLKPGASRIGALFLHGSVVNWPQQERSKQALQALDLLVVHDVEFPLSPTARMAHYVIATKKPFEIPAMTQYEEVLGRYHPGYGWAQPYAAYQPALLEPPPGADVLDAWQIYYRLGQKLGLKMRACTPFVGDPTAAPLLDMTREPTTDELYEYMCGGSVIPFAEVKKHPSGKLFDKARMTVAPRDPDCTAKLQLANADMLAELATVRTESIEKRRGTDAEFPYLYIASRMHEVTNASRRPAGTLKKTYNPAFMHPSDLERLGITDGDMVEIRSRHGFVVGVVEADKNLRPGLVAMCHGFGGNSDDTDYDPRRDGANVNRLLHWEDDYDPHHGQPRMSALPIAVTPLESKSAAA